MLDTGYPWLLSSTSAMGKIRILPRGWYRASGISSSVTTEWGPWLKGTDRRHGARGTKDSASLSKRRILTPNKQSTIAFVTKTTTRREADYRAPCAHRGVFRIPMAFGTGDTRYNSPFKGVVISFSISIIRTRTRANTNPNGTETNAASRSGNARALRKQSKCGMIQEREGHWPNSSKKLQKRGICGYCALRRTIKRKAREQRSS